MRALSRGIMHRLGTTTKTLFWDREFPTKQKDRVSTLAIKLDAFATLFELTPYDSQNRFRGKLLPMSYDTIQAVLAICPNSVVCIDANCQPRGLLQNTQPRDIPLVTVIKDNITYKDVPVLTGKCSHCGTSYSADHERFQDQNSVWNTCYLNSARFLKIGRAMWVDRKFSHSVLSGMYNFHASAAAYTQFWNDCNSVTDSNVRVTRRLIWQAFMQESIRAIASNKGINLELPERLSIKEVAMQAFSELGDSGMIEPAKGHACSECSQLYKAIADFVANEDPAAVLGADDNSAVPVLEGEDAEIAAQETIAARAAARARANQINSETADEEAMDVDYDNTTMIVLDGVVMSPTVSSFIIFWRRYSFLLKHCAFDGCTRDVKNARGGAFCEQHEIQYGDKCRVRDCRSIKLENSQACQRHQGEWKKYQLDHSRSALAGVRRMLQRPNENNAWEPGLRRTNQPHDEDEDEEIPRNNYFGPSRFYCVETMTFPCGVVIAWTKFDKSESPTKILNWLQSVFPTEDSRPNYICIDKACRVLRTSIKNKSWESWKKTSRFTVDSYHYINHRITDYLCRKWCNPAPLDGSAPNLVRLATDKNGQQYYQQAFNTQACEQLNAWLGGFESILKRMKSGNFDWFLHAMLFYHTQHVIEQQRQKEEKLQIDDSEEDEEDEDNADQDIVEQHWEVEDDDN
jgi:hypothetical protein